MSSKGRELNHIAVDLTPLMPGGVNGGAGLVATHLVGEMSRLAPEMTFTLLTNDRSHRELERLDASNVQRLCVVREPDLSQPRELAQQQARSLGRAVIDRVMPSAARVRVKNGYWSLVKRRARANVSAALNCDLLFCPFTAPYYFNEQVPLVSIIHDLQHLAYPEFFEDDQRRYRQQHVVDACGRAARVVCVSDSVRETLLDKVMVPADRAITIHLALLNTLVSSQPSERDSLLQRLRVSAGRFMLYPANFWPHKNHRALIDAHRQFQSDHPRSDLTIVCTGVPDERMEAIAEYARTVSPEGFVFAGYLVETELTALYETCGAVIFPSLYEGFGMPVLEAMARAKPVLCSNVTGLPEVVGDAAILFDPNDIRQMAEAMAAIEDRPEMVFTIAQRGIARARQFGTGADMAERYLRLFRDLKAQPSS